MGCETQKLREKLSTETLILQSGAQNNASSTQRKNDQDHLKKRFKRGYCFTANPAGSQIMPLCIQVCSNQAGVDIRIFSVTF